MSAFDRLRSGIRAQSSLYWIFFIGALLRLALALVTTASTDLALYASVARDGAFGRPLYSEYQFSYPPLFGDIFQCMGKIAALAHIPLVHAFPALTPFNVIGLNVSVLATPWAMLLLKLPTLLLDAGVAWLVLRICARLGLNQRQRAIAVALWWLNPVVFWFSAVQASWDAVIPLAMLGAVLAAFEGMWLALGASLAFGIMAKVVPVYEVTVAAILAVRLPSIWLERVTRYVAMSIGGFIIIAISLAPVATSGMIPNLHIALAARVDTFNPAGVTIFETLWLPWFHNVLIALRAHRDLSVRVLLIGQVLGLVPIWARLIVAKSVTMRSAVAGSLLMLFTVLISSPQVQPNYLIWLAPFFAIMAATDIEWMWWGLAISSIFFAFLVTIRSLNAVLLPACAFFHLCDAYAFSERSFAYSAQPGFLGHSMQFDVDTVIGLAGGIVLIIAYVRLWKWFAATTTVGSGMADRPGRRRFDWAFVFTVCLTLAVTVPVYGEHYNPGVSVSRRDATHAVVLSTGYNGPVSVMYGELRENQVERVFLYFDPKYAVARGGNQEFYNGFPSHFAQDARDRRLPLRATIINSQRLRTLLLSRPVASTLLFIAGGVLPDTVRTSRGDLLKRWLERGGIVIWAGGPFDVYWAQRLAVRGPDYSPWKRLYGDELYSSVFGYAPDTFSPPLRYGTAPAYRWAYAKIPSYRTTFPIHVEGLKAIGGEDVGWDDAYGDTSLAIVPVGRGRAIVFGDGFDDEIVAAQSLVQIVYGQLWDLRSSHLSTSGELTVHGGSPITIPVRPGWTVAIYGDGANFDPLYWRTIRRGAMRVERGF